LSAPSASDISVFLHNDLTYFVAKNEAIKITLMASFYSAILLAGVIAAFSVGNEK